MPDSDDNHTTDWILPEERIKLLKLRSEQSIDVWRVLVSSIAKKMVDRLAAALFEQYGPDEFEWELRNSESKIQNLICRDVPNALSRFSNDDYPEDLIVAAIREACDQRIVSWKIRSIKREGRRNITENAKPAKAGAVQDSMRSGEELDRIRHWKGLTIEDIADKAQVAEKTVSRVLKNKAVHPRKRKQVAEAILSEENSSK